MSQIINIKIMKNPDITDEEIKSHMNFDQLLQTYQLGSAPQLPKWVTISSYTAQAVLVISAIVFLALPPVADAVKKSAEPNQPVSIDSAIVIKEKPVQEKPKEKPLVSKKRFTTNCKASTIDSH